MVRVPKGHALAHQIIRQVGGVGKAQPGALVELRLLKDGGAKEVHVCISSPPVTDPCYYGIDTSVRKELIASTHTEDEICKYIGADSLHYISKEGLKRAFNSLDPEGMCYACFDTCYPDNAENVVRQGSKYLFENNK